MLPACLVSLVVGCGGPSGNNDAAVPDDRAAAFDTATDAVDSSVDVADLDGSIDVVDVVGVADARGADSGVMRTDASVTFTGVCAPAGSARTPPATLAHVIVIMMENKTLGQVMGSGMAPYFSGLVRQCGASDHFLDSVFGADDLPSEPHYLALVSGTNCGTGVSPHGTGCLIGDGDPTTSNALHVASLFSQVRSWKSYMEAMPSNCGHVSAGHYGAKHNPCVFYPALASVCAHDNVPLAEVHCPTTVNTVCSTPANAFVTDLSHDTLPAFSLISPSVANDMHDGTVSQGDNWLHTYIPLITHAAAYMRGEVAVYVMWDESAAGSAQPNLFISPYTPPTASHATMNLYSVLRSIERQLGVTTYLGCAGGTIGGGGTCASGSTTDLRHEFNF